MDKKTFTAAEMAEMMGMTPDAFSAEIKATKSSDAKDGLPSFNGAIDPEYVVDAESIQDKAEEFAAYEKYLRKKEEAEKQPSNVLPMNRAMRRKMR